MNLAILRFIGAVIGFAAVTLLLASSIGALIGITVASVKWTLVILGAL